MDIARPSNLRQKRIRRAVYGVVALSFVGLITLGVSRLKPAAPSVDRATVWIDTVKRGPMLRQVRGLGTLVPEDIRWIPATTSRARRTDRVRPGTVVDAGSVILELSNPQLEQELQDAALKLKAAEATLTNLRVQLERHARPAGARPPASRPTTRRPRCRWKPTNSWRTRAWFRT